MNTPPIKLVLVGDGAVGKQCLVEVFTKGKFPDEFIPIVFDSCRHVFTVDTRPAVLDIWQVAGLQDYDRLRPLSYPNTDVVLICFSIDSPTSLKNVIEKWHPEIRHFLPNAPIILVGLKLDLRHDVNCINYLEKRGLIPVSHEEGQKVADRIGAVKYVECSAKTNDKARAPFYAACKAVYLPKKNDKRKKTKAEIKSILKTQN